MQVGPGLWGLLGVGKCEVGAETDHAETRGGALGAVEADAGFEFAFERSGESDDQEIGGGVEADGDDAEYGELEKDVATFGGDELRDEREKKERGFGVEGFSENSLPESAAFWRGGARGKFCVARADHFDAEEDEIGGARILDRVKGDSRCGEDGGDDERGGEDVEESAKECS